MNRQAAKRGGLSVLNFLDDNYSAEDQKKVLTAALRLLKEDAADKQLSLNLYENDETVASDVE